MSYSSATLPRQFNNIRSSRVHRRLWCSVRDRNFKNALRLTQPRAAIAKPAHKRFHRNTAIESSEISQMYILIIVGIIKSRYRLIAIRSNTLPWNDSSPLSVFIKQLFDETQALFFPQTKYFICATKILYIFLINKRICIKFSNKV